VVAVVVAAAAMAASVAIVADRFFVEPTTTRRGSNSRRVVFLFEPGEHECARATSVLRAEAAMSGRPGFEVTTTQSPITLPAACCACGVKQGTKRISIQGVSGRVRRTFTVPYCDECLGARRKVKTTRALVVLALIALSGAIAALGVVLPMLPLPVLIAVPAALALVLGIFGPRLVARTQEVSDAARILRFGGNSTTFLLANEQWATHFAGSNQVNVARRTWRDGFTATSAVLCVLIGGGIAAYVGFASNPSVHVDNATSGSVKIWIDGEVALTVDAQSGRSVRPDLRLPYGAHKIGWSKSSETKPRDVETVQVAWGGDHLYNPAQAGCYFLQATAYGDASTSGLENGPLPLRSFYVFRDVDNWFEGNPTSITTKASGETRVALLPWASCEELTKQGCSVDVRKKAAQCARDAWLKDDEPAINACFERAIAKCE
jgi:hypothetical protein